MKNLEFNPDSVRKALQENQIKHTVPVNTPEEWAYDEDEPDTEGEDPDEGD